MDLRRALPIGLAVMLSVAACTNDGAAQPPPSSSAAKTFAVPAETARPDETVLHLPTTVDGDTSFLPLGLTAGLTMVIGSHAEWQAKGQYVRIRLLVTSTGRSTVLYDARRAILIDAVGTEYPVNIQAMAIKRQPDKVDLGSAVKLEYDVYFDIPKDAKPAKLRVFGGPTLTDQKDLTGPDIPLVS